MGFVMRKKKVLIQLVVVLCLIIFCICLIEFHRRADSPFFGREDFDSGTRLIMGTLGRVRAVATDIRTAREAVEAALEQLGYVEGLMSFYKPDSDLSKINDNAGKGAVEVSEATFYVLQKSVEYGRLTDGAFDVTVGPLEALWRQAERNKAVPDANLLQEVLSTVGYDKLILDANNLTVRFSVEGMRVDLGGIAKGYAIDRAVEAMKDAGAIGGLVDVGGDIRCFGVPLKNRSRWLIALQDSKSGSGGGVREGKYVLTLDVQGLAVATSGDYRRFVEIDGKRYGHIIDTKSGFSSSELSSVTIINPLAVDADVLATAVSVMGKEKGLKLVESLPYTEAIVISSAPDYEIFNSSGADEYIER
jgi:thiamine biosynthesis lipoprotein